jgi:DNA polymerase-4
LAAERTFSENLSSEIFMLEKLDHIADEVSRRLNNSDVSGKTITLKIKYSDFTLQTRSKTLPFYINNKAIILENAKELLYQDELKNSVRLLGISLSNLNTNKETSVKTKVDNKKSVSVQLKFDF